MSVHKINAVYQQGIEQADPFSFYWTNLRPLLMKYALTIGRSTTTQVEYHLLEEMVEDLLMDLSKYNGTVKFSTWAYTVFRNRFIDEHRYQTGNIGESLESVQSDWEARQPEDAEYFTDPYTKVEESTLERDTIVAEFVDSLAPRQRIVWEMYRDGHTQAEIGESLGIRQQSVDEIWQRILKLGEAYGAACKK